MKAKALICVIAAAFFAVVILPITSSGQESLEKRHPAYNLIDLGTFGGPEANLAQTAKILNNRGMFVDQADTSIPDPYYPNVNPFIWPLPKPVLQHAFLWKNGVLTDLGSLPVTKTVLPIG